MAMESLPLIVSDEVLSKFPKETDIIEDVISKQELSDQLEDVLGEKKFVVLSMKSAGWSFREIAEHLEKLGYVNRQGNQVTRQAVKAILDDALKTIEKLKSSKDNT
jgi:Mg2+ and Co2+ transporter CorA